MQWQTTHYDSNYTTVTFNIT